MNPRRLEAAAPEKYDRIEKVKTWARTTTTPSRTRAGPDDDGQAAFSVDQFTIAFVDMTDQGGKIAMTWENTGGRRPVQGALLVSRFA